AQPRGASRRAETPRGQRDQAATLVRVPPRRDRGGAAAAALIAGAATRRGAMESRKILFCATGARFIPSLRARARSNCVCAWGCEGNEAFIGGGYRREYWR